MPASVAAIDTPQEEGQQAIKEDKVRALWFTDIGIAGPAVVASALTTENKKTVSEWYLFLFHFSHLSWVSDQDAFQMSLAKIALFALMAFLLGACKGTVPDGASPGDNKARSAPAGSVSLPSKKQDVPNVSNEAQHVSDTPPAPASVLYFIYQKDGDGAVSYEIENGSWANYWYGYSFELGGKQYFTGFAYDTPEKYGKSDEEDYPGPDANVTLTQATFVLTAPGTKDPWTFQGSQRSVGEFGGYEKANVIDEKRRPQSYRAENKLLLAIPTWYLISGTRVSAFDVFVFNPNELTKIDEKRWTYLGNVVAGEDNSAACDADDGGKLACVSSSGTLSFVPQGSGMPVIRVEMSGTQVASAGKVRTLGVADAVEYRYDSSKQEYLQ